MRIDARCLSDEDGDQLADLMARVGERTRDTAEGLVDAELHRLRGGDPEDASP